MDAGDRGGGNRQLEDAVDEERVLSEKLGGLGLDG